MGVEVVVVSYISTPKLVDASLFLSRGVEKYAIVTNPNIAKTNNTTNSNSISNSSSAAQPEADPEPTLTLLDETQHPVVTMEMSNGGIVKIELYPEIAPQTVSSLLF